MKIADVFGIVHKFDAQFVTGQVESERKVSAIEVMEVPEVEYWAREGLLLITTFYAVKENPKKQYEIIKKMIHCKAAGVIVKVGRFIPKLPEEIIKLAKHHNFPIFVISKDIPYIDILTPLYTQLHSIDLSVHNEQSTLNHFENMPFNSVENAIEYLESALLSTVYIEDDEGKLIYSTKNFVPDGWRESQLLYSKPSYHQCLQLLQKWTNQSQNNIYRITKIPGQKDRLAIPLSIRENHMILIHIVYNKRKHSSFLEDIHVKAIKNKLYAIMMGELFELQQDQARQVESLNILTHEGKKDEKYILLFLYRELNNTLVFQHNTLIDYICLFRKKISDKIKRIQALSRYLIFEKDSDIYALLCFSKHENTSTLWLKNYLTDVLKDSPIQDTLVSISSVFYHPEELENKINSIRKIMKIKESIHLNENVVSQNKLGIYEFLIKLSIQPDVRQYVESILEPLEQSDPVLLETLKIYLKENGNASKVAKKMFINRRTITNRLQKIKELLGTDLNDAENIFILQFCLKVKWLE